MSTCGERERGLRIIEARTRLLLPLEHDGTIDELRESVLKQALLPETVLGELPAWRWLGHEDDGGDSSLPEAYSHEMPVPVLSALLGGREEGTDGPRTAVLEANYRSNVLGAGLWVAVPRLLACPVRIDRVELFASRFGFAMCSLLLRFDLSRTRLIYDADEASVFRRAGLDGNRAAQVRTLVYRLAGHDRFEASRNPYFVHAGDDFVQPGAGHEPLSVRLGRVRSRATPAPGWWTLNELFGRLLPAGLRPLHAAPDPGGPGPAGGAERARAFGPLNVFTAVRVGAALAPAIGFEDNRLPAAASLASGLAQAEEPTHGGIPHDAPNGLWAMRDRCTICACSTQGAAFVVAEQVGQVEYNRQRAQAKMVKYFLPYLLAVHQRVHAAIASRRIASAVADGAQQDLLKLRDELFQFRACADLSHVSSRDAVNQWYAQAQRANQSREALARIDRLITDVDAALHRRRLESITAEGKETLAALHEGHERIAWLEVFVLGVYTLELVHTVAPVLRFPHLYEVWSLVLLPPIVCLIAVGELGLLKDPSSAPHGRHLQPRGARARSRLLRYAVVYALWLIVGYVIAGSGGDPAGHPAGSAGVSAGGHPSPHP